MNLPAWVSPLGLAEHAILGLLMTLMVLLIPAPWNAVAASAYALLIHEQAQNNWSDFRLGQPGAPWNGVLDVLSGVVPALAFALYSLL